MIIIFHHSSMDAYPLSEYYKASSNDVNIALTDFYSEHEYPTISEAMFKGIISNLNVEQGVILHNAICPRFYITEIIVSDSCVYAETEEQEND